MKYCLFKKTFGTLRLGFFLFLFLVNATVDAVSQAAPLSTGLPPERERFEAALDLITVNGQSNEQGIFGDTIKLYDRKGNLWYEYGIDRGGAQISGRAVPKTLRLIFPNNSRFFKLVAISNTWYEVEVDSESGESKFLRIDDPFLRRDGIQLRLLLSPYIGFDAERNPLRDKVGGMVLKTDFQGATFKAVSVDGDWLQVEVQARKSRDDGLAEIGWVRWKKDQRLLVSFGYR